MSDWERVSRHDACGEWNGLSRLVREKSLVSLMRRYGKKDQNPDLFLTNPQKWRMLSGLGSSFIFCTTMFYWSSNVFYWSSNMFIYIKCGHLQIYFASAEEPLNERMHFGTYTSAPQSSSIRAFVRYHRSYALPVRCECHCEFSFSPLKLFWNHSFET
jgi:hypothetical protein